MVLSVKYESGISERIFGEEKTLDNKKKNDYTEHIKEILIDVQFAYSRQFLSDFSL